MPRPSVLLIAALALAGCATPLPAAEGEGPDAATDVLPWTLTRCTYLVGWSPADPAKLQARLPEGFSIVAARPFGVAGVPLAYLGTEIFDCERGSGIDGEVERMAYGSIWYNVEVPEEARVDGITFTMMKEEILVPDAARRERLLTEGLSVHDGAIEWLAPTAPGGVAGRLTLATYGAFTLSLEAPQQGTAPAETDEFVEYTPASAGLARWRASYAWDEAAYSTGRGTIAWPEGTWAADAVGSSVAPAQFHRGVWSFTGNVTLPR